MNSRLVSIVMPTYNCDSFIGDSIRSVLAQTYTDWELLIVDDCSTDNTETIVRSVNDTRIKYFRNECNSGAALSRNKALREATGRYIAFLDSDDLWFPEKLEQQVMFMETNGYHFSYHEYDEIDEENNSLGVHVSGKWHVNRFDMFSCCWPGCLTVMYDVKKIGLIQIEDVKKNNDAAIWLKAINKTDCYLLPNTLGQYRRRRGSITPPGLIERIRWIYLLFRKAEHMNVATSSWWTACNLVGHFIKKTCYIKHIEKT